MLKHTKVTVSNKQRLSAYNVHYLPISTKYFADNQTRFSHFVYEYINQLYTKMQHAKTTSLSTTLPQRPQN